MHPMEYKKEKVGTGRFSHLILNNSEIIVDICFDENKRLLELLYDDSYQSFLLYPGKETIDLGGNQLLKVIDNKKPQFLVIDGTWPCAKKMMKLSRVLHPLPRVSFHSEKISEFKIKHQPMLGCLSTVESIYQMLIDLNRMGLEETASFHDNLLEVLRYTVNQQIQLALDPKRQGYRKKAFSDARLRKTSKKWDSRLLFFNTEED